MVQGRSKELEEAILKDRTPEQQLILKANWSLCDLRQFYELNQSEKQYRVNALLREIEDLMKEAGQ
jgi:hypothetical protein